MKTIEQDLKLNRRQANFCREFVKDRNASAAARRAGYSPISAGPTSVRLMKMPNIMRMIDHVDNLALDTTWLNGERVLLELARIAFLDLGNAFKVDPDTDKRYLDFDLLNEDQIKALSSVEFEKEFVNVLNPNYDATAARVAEEAGRPYEEKKYLVKPATKIKFKMYDKLKALELMARHYGLLNVADDDKNDMAQMLLRALQRKDERMIDVTPEEEKDDE